MINTIIFDIGRVLVKFEWREYIDSFHFSPETARIVGEAVFTTPTWNEYDRGALSDQEILSQLIANAPDFEKEITMVFQQFPYCLEKLPYATNWITSLKEQGYKIYYLSNFAKTTRENCGEVLDFMNLCDGGLMSYEVKLTKPEPQIYLELFHRFHITPENAVFIDDNEANIAEGTRLGLNTILFTDYESASKTLHHLLHP